MTLQDGYLFNQTFRAIDPALGFQLYLLRQRLFPDRYTSNWAKMFLKQVPEPSMYAAVLSVCHADLIPPICDVYQML